MKKILINAPDWHDPSTGGVAAFYYGMLGYWNEDVFYNAVGRRKGVSGLFWLPWDVAKFVCKLLFWQPDVVLINPSLFREAMTRDFVFLNIAKFLNKPVCVLIHGFDLGVAKTIDHDWISSNLNKASLVLVLANEFREILREWKVTVPIELISTKVEDRMLEGFDVNCRDGKIKNILFLSRVIKEKGVYETIDTYGILKKKYPYLTLTIVGDGKELEPLKSYARNHDVKDVNFTGALSGKARLDAYKEASFFFFFSSYGEGMPTVILEAMAFGLPILTRKVGGLVDFFEDGKMGRITDSLNPECYAELMDPYLTDRELSKETSLYNHRYALEHFMATKVGKRIESLISQYTQLC